MLKVRPLLNQLHQGLVRCQLSAVASKMQSYIEMAAE
jgi:hypothetical protein